MQRHQTVLQAEQIVEAFLTDLEAIVNIDSGTYYKAGIDQVAAYLQKRFQDFGFITTIDEQVQAGNNMIATHQGNNPNGPHLLVLGHMDTVFQIGEAARRPFSIVEQDGRQIAKGPGVLDMKSGVLMGIYGLYLLISSGQANYKQVTFICNSDEETGSQNSKPLIRRVAQDVDAVLVLEPGRQLDAFVSARRGIGHYKIEVQGIAAHAGVEPDKGRNAILELAHQILAVQALNGTIPGTTLNVGIIRGGERTNIVPDYAYCEIDVRVSSQAGANAIDQALRDIAAQRVLDGTRITLTGGLRAQPFECTGVSEQLTHLVKETGQQLGLTLRDVASGGASDANTTAGMGIATVDGLGSGGGLAHNPDEYIELEYLPTRIALFTEIVRALGNAYNEGLRLRKSYQISNVPSRPL